MNDQGIIQIIGQRRLVLRGEAVIPQGADVHHDVPVFGAGVPGNEKIPHPQGVLQLIEGGHFMALPLIEQVMPVLLILPVQDHVFQGIVRGHAAFPEDHLGEVP